MASLSWFKMWTGATRDTKLDLVSERSGASIGDVFYIWAALLESAAEVNNCGTCFIPFQTVSRRLGITVPMLQEIMDNFEKIGMVKEGAIVNWSKRQGYRDNSSDRVRKFREREKANLKKKDKDVTRFKAVTKRLRNGSVTGTEAEADIVRSKKEGSVPGGTGEKSPDPTAEMDRVLFSESRVKFGESCGGQITKLKRARGVAVALDDVRRAPDGIPGLEYVAGILRSSRNGKEQTDEAFERLDGYRARRGFR